MGLCEPHIRGSPRPYLGLGSQLRPAAAAADRTPPSQCTHSAGPFGGDVARVPAGHRSRQRLCKLISRSVGIAKSSFDPRALRPAAGSRANPVWFGPAVSGGFHDHRPGVDSRHSRFGKGTDSSDKFFASGGQTMKLLNFYASSGQKALGMVEGDRVIDLFAASGNKHEFASVGAWLRAGESAGKALGDLRERGAKHSLSFPALKHAPLIERDARVFCVGLNYADHAAENNLPPPSSPIFFSKLAAVVIPHKTGIPIPKSSQQVDYEAEFALVIGRRADCVNEADALAC